MKKALSKGIPFESAFFILPFSSRVELLAGTGNSVRGGRGLGPFRLAFGVVDGDGAEFFQHCSDLASVSDGYDLKRFRVDVLTRDTLYIVGRDGHDARRI